MKRISAAGGRQSMEREVAGFERLDDGVSRGSWGGAA